MVFRGLGHHGYAIIAEIHAERVGIGMPQHGDGPWWVHAGSISRVISAGAQVLAAPCTDLVVVLPW